MKLNKFNLLAAAALGVLMACGPIARAQDNSTPTPPATPPPPAAPGDNNGTTPPPRPGRGGGGGIQAVLAKLDLSDDQKTKVGEALKTQRDKTMALRGDTSLTPEDRRAKMKDIREELNTTLKGILTSEQFTKFQDGMKNMRPGGRPGGAPPPAPATPPATGN